MENEEVYVLLKTTTSDNSGGKKVKEKLDMVYTEKGIEERAIERKKENRPDLMHSFRDEDGSWKALPSNLNYVTIPTNTNYEGNGYKAVAFKIKKMLNNRKKSVIIFVVLREGGIKLTKVVVRNGNVDSALRMLKQKNVKDGLSKKVRERQEGYLKPGVKRRLEKKENIKNSRRRNKERY